MGSLTPASLITTGLGALTGGLSQGILPFAAGLDAQEQRRQAIRQSQDMALQQLKAQQKLQSRELQQRAELDRNRLDLESAQQDNQRRRALKRAVARQNVRFGSGGISRDGGSAEAVLLGLFEESEEDRRERERLDTLRSRAIDLDISTDRSRNVLEATQLAQQQQLERLSGF